MGRGIWWAAAGTGAVSGLGGPNESMRKPVVTSATNDKRCPCTWTCWDSWDYEGVM